MSTQDAAAADVSLPPVRKSRKAAEALVVLGAKLDAEGAPSPALARRVAHAAALWRQGVAPVVVASGGATAAPGGPTEAAVMARLLSDVHGLPAAAIVVEGSSRNTLGNARETLALAEAQGWNRLTVVTDDMHLPRALWTFRRLGRPLGVRVEGAAAPGPRALSTAWWAHGLREAAALVLYAWRLR